MEGATLDPASTITTFHSLLLCKSRFHLQDPGYVLRQVLTSGPAFGVNVLWGLATHVVHIVSFITTGDNKTESLDFVPKR